VEVFIKVPYHKGYITELSVQFFTVLFNVIEEMELWEVIPSSSYEQNSSVFGSLTNFGIPCFILYEFGTFVSLSERKEIISAKRMTHSDFPTAMTAMYSYSNCSAISKYVEKAKLCSLPKSSTANLYRQLMNLVP